jgi:hypothetical protein
MELTTADLESRLTLLFSTMEARKAAIRREREDRKLSRRRYWWQEPQTERNQTPCHENP